MAAISDRALALRVIDFGETSRIATLFARDAGRLDVIAKGTMRPKAALRGGPFPLVAADIVYYPSRSGGLATLAGYEVTHTFAGVRRSLDRIYAAWAVGELLMGWIAPGLAEPDLYDLAIETLAGIARDGPSPWGLFFEIRGLVLHGVGPELDRCAHCGGALVPRASSPRPAFAAAAGGALCPSCRKGVPGARPAHAGALRLLAALRETPPSRLSRLRLDRGMALACREMLDACHAGVLGRAPVMSAYRGAEGMAPAGGR